ncbi:glycerophosphodiester phosphodiesterase [Alkalihalobacterium chitinilyticum]|uniref:Glycerophosphodiester phosphodiesterase n=1 Tax=Alkalihalobacterium chitinilyticum TaxID=2980103 RepID=A0ABT5VLH5_9BACI|nr:glycerophosphodiester phosphodiesterase [Alkalihalobacterium chitinilyticum]MDE5416283.1 glycerophosphodiester phosphodiesterase [Alkalihalobacterium chitinilyticum]
MANIATNQQKKRRWLSVMITIIVVIIGVWMILNFLPVQERAAKPFFESERPMVIAHQGGEHLAPSNTIVAFEQARQLGVDVIEFDVHITKDEQLVAIHDSTVDRTTDGEGSVAELTLEEIQQLDAGYYFQDLDGEYSFRGKGITIPTVEEIFDNFSEMKMVIELKATNPPSSHQVMSELLWELLQRYELEERVLIASFDHSIIEAFDELADGRVAISGGREEITNFVVFNKLFLNGLYRPNVDAVQIPTEESIFDLTSSRLIKAAHRKGMEVHYWTINDEETMKLLLDQGADGIITDRPDLLLNLLENQ